MTGKVADMEMKEEAEEAAEERAAEAEEKMALAVELSNALATYATSISSTKPVEAAQIATAVKRPEVWKYLVSSLGEAFKRGDKSDGANGLKALGDEVIRRIELEDLDIADFE